MTLVQIANNLGVPSASLCTKEVEKAVILNRLGKRREDDKECIQGTEVDEV